MAQLPFAFGPRTMLGAEDYLISDCNRDAAAWIDRWPDWPGAVLWLAGPPGSGKSHLGAIWARRAGAGIVAGKSLTGDHAATLSRPLMVEDVDAGIDQTALFHLVNRTRELGLPLLLTSAHPPARLGLTLADLASRLNALPVAVIAAPDEALLAGLLVKLFADRQIAVEQAVIGYLLTRIERSFAAARDVVDALDHAALAGQRGVTVPLARAVLGDR